MNMRVEALPSIYIGVGLENVPVGILDKTIESMILYGVQSNPNANENCDQDRNSYRSTS